MKKVFSLLLSMMLLCSFALAATSARAATTSGMEFNKTAVANDDGTYTITLEAYATGSKVISTVTKDVPTDIILVLDQSGSMDNDIGTVSFSQRFNASNSTLYAQRHNGGSSNLWHKLEDGTYVSVSVNVQETASYTKITNGRNNPGYGSSSYTNLWSNSENLYVKVNGQDVKVTVSRSGNRWDGYTYTYTIPANTVIATSEGDNGTPTITGTDDNALYLRSVDGTQSVYTYTYTDSQGVTQTIGTSTGANTTFSPTLYQRDTSSNGGGSRLNALKTAVTTFANNVAAKAAGADGNIATTEDNVNHRIAMVGFAGTNSSYGNSEILIGRNQYNYNVNASQYYDDAFQDMSTTQGQTNITNSIAVLDADGGTHPDHGLTMANGIFNANPIEAGSRHRVVIVFTDGVPGDYGFDSSVASSAISQAGISKETYGATVFTVGVFSGADATSAGNQNGTETQKANWFMQQMSSNNGTVQNPSYYLSAGDAATLNNIFKQISQNIQSGSSSATLTEEAVVKDLIAPQFTLPENATAADITVETYKCSGKDANGNYTWTKNNTTMGAAATVVDGQVSVTGFDFADNYVAEIKTNNVVTGYQGHKLVIKFTVTPEDNFLGGNDVYTNTSAGIYENKDAETPVVEFNRPQVNVPIENVEVTVDAGDLNVYLLEDVTLAQIKESTNVKCGDVILNLNATNYGLPSTMTEYVNITATYTDENGNVLTDLNDLKADTKYSVAVSVAPKATNPVSTQGETAVLKSDSDEGDINVFMPVLTFADSAENYLSTPANAADYYNQTNYKDVVWKHGDTVAANMETETAPTLTLTYAPALSTWIDSSNKVSSTADVPVNVSVAINGVAVDQYTKAVRNACSECGFEATEATEITTLNPEFIVHIKNVYGELKIVKNGLLKGESAVFTVSGIVADGTATGTAKTWKVVLTAPANETAATATITGLLVNSTYSVEEDDNWTWTYDEKGSVATSTTILAKDASGAPATITFENEEKDQWMNDESAVVNAYKD